MRCLSRSLPSVPLALVALSSATSLAADPSEPVDALIAQGVPQAHLAVAGEGLNPPAADGFELAPPPLTVPDEFIVRFTSDAALVVRTMATGDGMTGFGPIDDVARATSIVGFRPLYPGADRISDELRGLPDMSGWYVARVDTSATSRDDAMASFDASPFVVETQVIGIHPVAATPNDGWYSSQWFLNQASDKDIDAPEGWDIENGSPSVVVAVLDTGVRYYHKDLGGSAASSSNVTATNGNIWINTAEKNGVAGVDDDGNGYVDDWVGYDFVTAAAWTCWTGEDCTGADNDPRDFNGHGTHCAGIVAAMNNNGYAVASAGGGFGSGTNTPAGDGVKVMCLRIGHSANYGGQEVGFVRMDSAASAFYYAANKGAKIASCSWGSSNSGGIAAAVSYFVASGGLIFKAAGNDGTQTADYLCSRSDVYSVVATDQSDKKASFSTYGTWADISAPGVSIYSTYHVHSDSANDYVAALDGTSMATPLVASVAAVVWSANSGWDRAQVWDKVKTSCDPIDALNPSYAGKLGAGRVNLNNALGGGSGGGGPTGKLLLSLSGSPSLTGVGTVADEDIVQFDLATGSWSLYFDGSDVGLASFSIDAFARLPNGDLLISTAEAGSLSGLTGAPSGTSFDDSDILRFTPTTLGATTAGSWSFYFDGSDVGLTTDNEDIDALAILPDGRLLISTLGSPSVTGLSSLQDKDLIAFQPTGLGSVTAGTWSYWFDGSDVSLTTSNEDVDAAFVSSSGLLSISTLGAFAVPGVSGTGRDYFDFLPTSTGAVTAGTYSPFFVGSSAGLPSTANITGAEEIP